MAQTSCRYFTGYKPCGKNSICDELCPSRDIPQVRILIVHLEALGAVVRSTALLTAIKRKFPSSHITWMTSRPARALLQTHPLIDRVLVSETEDLLKLEALSFDVAFAVDKSLVAGGILKSVTYDLLFGFTVESSTGAIIPATPAALELWNLGLSDQKKFFENKKSEAQLVHEALELGPYKYDEYNIHLTKAERAEASSRRKMWANSGDVIVGINTGSSAVIPYKKLPVDRQRELIQKLTLAGFNRIVLLGGPEDEERNQRIAHNLNVVQSPTNRGLRDGLVSVEACDIVISGDSLGMHMAIALQKWVVAWFGPTCAHEIELYGRGVRVKTKASCSPCWKRSCKNDPMCYDLVSLEELVQGAIQGRQWLKSISSSKPPSSEISSSPSL